MAPTQLESVEDYISLGLTHQIHNSERMSRRGCRRRWDWVFRQMYYPTITAKPLEFGVAFHKAMEALYDPINRMDGTDTAYALARTTFHRTCMDQRASFINLHPELYTDEVDEDYKERVELGLGMLDYWYTTVMPKYESGLTSVKVEIPFEVPIEPTVWCKCDQCWQRYQRSFTDAIRSDLERFIRHASCACDGDQDLWREHHWIGLPVTLGGRVDALMEDAGGGYWIVDWKTTARMTNAEGGAVDDFMLLDDQITSYCLALKRVLNLPIKGFIYIEIKKAYPREPEPNKVQRMGRWYSINKQQSTSAEVYRRTVMENDPVAYEQGLYDEFIGYLEGLPEDIFVHWHQIIRNDTELANAANTLWQEAKEMVDPAMAVYPSPGRFSCVTCAFQDPCIAKNRGDDFQYTLDTLYERRERHYWETALPTTDKRQ